MSTMRLARSLHTTAALANTAVSWSAAALSVPVAETVETAPRKFTPKGRPIPVRPPRQVRVTLPNGYPEPPSYPPPVEYFEEVAKIKDALLEAPGGETSPKRHPLWSFFHVPKSATMELTESQEHPPDCGSVERLDDEQTLLSSGRAWNAQELRIKSFGDLHTLWYVLLRERNVLATQREERRRLGVTSGYGGELLVKRAHRVRKSMARIKFILNERRLALISAGAAVADPDDNHYVPSTVRGVNDPMAHVEALRGTGVAPSLKKLTGKRMTPRDKARMGERVREFWTEQEKKGEEPLEYAAVVDELKAREREQKRAVKADKAAASE